MHHLCENRHVLHPDFDVRFNVQKKRGWLWFSVEFAGTKKEAEASVFNDLQISVDICRSTSGAGNETRIWRPTH